MIDILEPNLIESSAMVCVTRLIIYGLSRIAPYNFHFRFESAFVDYRDVECVLDALSFAFPLLELYLPKIK